MPESLSDSQVLVVQLRDLFQKTGVLHDVQIQNLQVWPRLAFPTARSCTASVDIFERVVLFDLDMAIWRRLPGDVVARCKGLAESVQFLLGGDFQVRVSRRGELIFSGERTQAVKERDFEGTDYDAGRIVPEKNWNFQKKKP